MYSFFLAREAAIKRWSNPKDTSFSDGAGVGVGVSHHTQQRKVVSLTELCITLVSRRLPGDVVRQPYTSLGLLPRVIVNRILKMLVAERTLRPKTLGAFLSWLLVTTR